MRTPLVMLVLVFAVGCAAGPEDHPAYDAVLAANRELERRFEANDGLGVAAMYTDDALMLGPNQSRTEGREAIDAYWDRERVEPSWELSIDRLEGDIDRPIQRGRSVLGREWNGQMRFSTVEFVLIWERQPDGSYRAALDAWWDVPD